MFLPSLVISIKLFVIFINETTTVKYNQMNSFSKHIQHWSG
jgi:hypothetical protein